MMFVEQKTIALWPQPAPGALGDTEEDIPAVSPFLPQAEAPVASVIICPGGGYCRRAGHEAEPVARWLAGLGVAAFVLRYRVKPYKYPVPLTDAQRAVRVVRAGASEWNIDPQRVGILGFSAGGHLAASAATMFDDGFSGDVDPVQRQSSRPDALIACYPVLTFGDHRHDGSMRALLGDEDGRVDPELQERLSLENRVTEQTPPTFLWHTVADQAVPVENVFLFASALRRNGVPFALHLFPEGHHGLGLAESLPHVGQWTDLCAAWLTEIGF
ncbi:MAG: alpha/beta hydrolase [Phycisphaerae bacterium]